MGMGLRASICERKSASSGAEVTLEMEAEDVEVITVNVNFNGASFVFDLGLDLQPELPSRL
jgi:hypothetical protein